ncbi:MAG TPA: hypothetical protein VLD37_01915 [Candidatus Bilamarchaeum sp.]|nr:hypothetical protein [Candidatus Bilamarchaeum sp.]
MGDLRRTIRCASCGYEATVSMSTELEVKEVMFAARCRCGSTLQVNYSLVGDTNYSPAQKSEESGQMVNLDETLFAPEIPSDTLRDIMDD